MRILNAFFLFSSCLNQRGVHLCGEAFEKHGFLNKNTGHQDIVAADKGSK